MTGYIRQATEVYISQKRVTFLHQIKRCFGILFGLSAQVNMTFIFEI
jgi:hypothetical protein